VAAFASRRYRESNGRPFFAITGQSTEPYFDETRYASIVAKAAGLDWQIVRPESTDFQSAIDDVVRTQEEPFGSPSVFMQYFVMRAAREANCPVLLDGQGSDEIFGGYEGYSGEYIASLLARGRILAAARAVANLRGFKIHRVEALSRAAFALGGPRVRQVLGEFRRGGLGNAQRANAGKHAIYSRLPFTDFLIREITVRSLPRLLRYEDRNSMRFSIETRLPFLDFNVVETALGVPEDLRMTGGFPKYPLRRAVGSQLPPEIIWRTNKFGFEAPTATWVASIRPRMDAEIRGSSLLAAEGAATVSGLDQGALWRRFNLARWESVFGVEGFGAVAA
jgi:asparagine synthase (glutamine-hydrolysing)